MAPISTIFGRNRSRRPKLFFPKFSRDRKNFRVAKKIKISAKTDPDQRSRSDQIEFDPRSEDHKSIIFTIINQEMACHTPGVDQGASGNLPLTLAEAIPGWYPFPIPSFYTVSASFYTVFAPFRIVFSTFVHRFGPFRIVLGPFRAPNVAKSLRKRAKTCEKFRQNFTKIYESLV